MRVRRRGSRACLTARDAEARRRGSRVLASAGTPILLAWIACALLGACDTISETEREQSPTGGVEMSLQILRTATQQYQFFKVTAKGEIEYGGGMRAFNSTTGWSGAMSAEEIREFLTLLESTGWCAQEPPDDRESATRVQIAVRCAEGRHTWNVRGEPETVTRMEAFLDPIARRRLNPELDRLPEATEKRAMTRGAQPSRTSEATADGGGAPNSQPSAAPSTTPAPPP